MNKPAAAAAVVVAVAIAGAALASYLGGGESAGQPYGSTTYYRIQISGLVRSKMNVYAIDEKVVACTANGGYDITLWFPTVPKELNANGVFEAIKKEAVLHVSGYDCLGYNGAENLCIESVANGPIDLPFELSDSADKVFYAPQGGKFSYDRVGFSAKQPGSYPSITVHSVCPTNESDTTDYGMAFSQLVMPLVSSPITLKVPDYTPNNDVSWFEDLPAVGNVLADMELSLKREFVNSLE